MRLVQSQEEEEEELARALREAHGEPHLRRDHHHEDGEEEAARGIKVAGGEESEDESGDKVVVSGLPSVRVEPADLSVPTTKRFRAIRRGPTD